MTSTPARSASGIAPSPALVPDAVQFDLAAAVTTTELVAHARATMSAAAWARLEGGVETETTLKRNRLGFDTLAFRPRALVNVTEIDTSSTVLGHKLRIPVMTAPIGSSHLFTPGGADDVVRAVEDYGSVPIVSSMTKGTTWEDLAGVTGGPKFLTLSMTGDDPQWARDAIARAKEVGYAALCLAFDTPRFGRMERDMLASHQPIRPTPWLRTGMSWKLLREILRGNQLPLIAKGITHPEDARRLAEMGFEVIYLSNHGGHALDHSMGTIDHLPEVVDAVQGKAQVILDSGVMRGTDVVKALALGASAVAIGRLQCLGLAAGGRAGLVRLLELLEEEIFYAMTYLGAPSVADLSRDHIISGAPAVSAPSVLSAFPLLGE